MNLTDVLTQVPAPEAENFNFEKECRITSETVLPEIKPSIIIDDSWLCTDGGILVVSGQKKAGKSNAIVFIIATALMEEVDTQKTLLIRSKKQDLDIVYIDTEQSPNQTQTFIKRAKSLAGISGKDPGNLRFYNIRKCDLEKRNEFLRWILEKPEKIGLLIIDGVADFVSSINDEEKTRQLGDFLFSKLHDKMSMVTVIHEGKDGAGAMGHLGQYLEKKCSGTIALFKNRKERTHRITCKMVRVGGDFDDIEFTWSEDEKGFVLLSEEVKNLLNMNKDETEKQELKSLFSNIFYEKTEMPHSTLRERIIGHDPKIRVDSSKPAKQKAALRRIEKALESGVLTVIREEKRDKIYQLIRD